MTVCVHSIVFLGTMEFLFMLKLRGSFPAGEHLGPSLSIEKENAGNIGSVRVCAGLCVCV